MLRVWVSAQVFLEFGYCVTTFDSSVCSCVRTYNLLFIVMFMCVLGTIGYFYFEACCFWCRLGCLGLCCFAYLCYIGICLA